MLVVRIDVKREIRVEKNFLGSNIPRRIGSGDVLETVFRGKQRIFAHRSGKKFRTRARKALTVIGGNARSAVETRSRNARIFDDLTYIAASAWRTVTDKVVALGLANAVVQTRLRKTGIVLALIEQVARTNRRIKIVLVLPVDCHRVDAPVETVQGQVVSCSHLRFARVDGTAEKETISDVDKCISLGRHVARHNDAVDDETDHTTFSYQLDRDDLSGVQLHRIDQ